LPATVRVLLLLIGLMLATPLLGAVTALVLTSVLLTPLVLTTLLLSALVLAALVLSAVLLATLLLSALVLATLLLSALVLAAVLLAALVLATLLPAALVLIIHVDLLSGVVPAQESNCRQCQFVPNLVALPKICARPQNGPTASHDSAATLEPKCVPALVSA
jgi:hypothetical protein